MQFFMVLPSGTTYAPLEGCQIVAVSDEFMNMSYQFELELEDNDAATDLDAAIDEHNHGGHPEIVSVSVFGKLNNPWENNDD